jgi:5-formyltetrahydrofolate cyclo-ligase
MNKADLRQRFCALRECMPPEQIDAASTALCQRLAAWPVLCEAKHVLAYLAFRNEPNLDLLFERLPHISWLVPRIVQDNRMTLHRYDPARLVRHHFGMLEPAADLPKADPATVDVVLVPGVAFDRHGGRIGFGGGYYDRFLLTTRGMRVGIAFDECLADELPCDEHDQRMEWVATPSAIIHCATREHRL